MRAPDGSLLVQGFGPPHGFDPTPYWLDRTTGKTYAGDPAVVSPDGSRIATLVNRPDRQQIIRQYDFATGRALSDLVAGVEEGYGSVLGFDWTLDSHSLIVAVAPGKSSLGGLYVVDRDAHRLPGRPTLANAVPAAFTSPDVYASPAVLADGHVVAFEYQFPVQHDSWGGAVVDIDLRTGATRTVLGSTIIFGNALTVV